MGDFPTNAGIPVRRFRGRNVGGACAGCGASLDGRRKHARFCSSACSKEFQRREWRKANPQAVQLPTGTTGAMHEMAVAIDLLRRGLYVYRSLTPNAPSDLAVLYRHELIRVEVTTGYKNLAGRVSYPTKDHSKFDLLAVVVRDEGIIYEPAIEELLLSRPAPHKKPGPKLYP
jgi:hypothetical protein